MDQRLQIIQEQRKLQGVKWKELAENLPISGEGLRIAFSRGSVDPTYLKIIEQRLGITKPTKEKEKVEGRFENVLSSQVLEDLEPYLDQMNTKLDAIIELMSRMDGSHEQLKEMIEATHKDVLKHK